MNLPHSDTSSSSERRTPRRFPGVVEVTIVMRSRVALTVGFLLVVAVRSQAQGAATWSSEPTQLERSPGLIAGTLVLPVANGRRPLAVIIAGSGPTDRDGNTAGAPRGPTSLRQLAESLATKGIASVRYDKRGIAGSASAATKESDLRFDSLVADAVALVRKYRADKRFSTIIVVGHSEGALIGLLAAREAGADGYVSLEGPARRADIGLHEQLEAAQLGAVMRAQADTIMAALVAGRTVTDVPTYLTSLFRPSVQPYLISWFRHSAAEEIRSLAMPCLVVQGTSDIQVMPAEATLLKAANPACESRLIDGMNHVLKHTPNGRAEQMPSYFDPTIPLAPGLAEAVTGFVKSVSTR